MQPSPHKQLPEVPDMIYMQLLKPLFLFQLGKLSAPDRKDVALFIMARSGLASKHGINLANGVGLVDSDYRGELLVPLMNLGKEPFSVEPGMRIAQLVVLPVLFPTCTVVEQLPETERGTNGFGSTGAF